MRFAIEENSDLFAIDQHDLAHPGMSSRHKKRSGGFFDSFFDEDPFGFDPFDGFMGDMFSGGMFGRRGEHRNDNGRHRNMITDGGEQNGMGGFFDLGGFGTGSGASFSSFSSFSSGGDGERSYQSSSTSSLGPGGVMQTKMIEKDSSGRQKVVTKRQLGEKAVETIEESDADNRRTIHNKLQNMSVDDMNRFDQEWADKQRNLPKVEAREGRGAKDIFGQLYGSSDEDGVDMRRALPGSSSDSGYGSQRRSRHGNGVVIEEADDDEYQPSNVVSETPRVDEPEYIPASVTNTQQQQSYYTPQRNQRGGQHRMIAIEEVDDQDERVHGSQHRVNNNSTHGLTQTKSAYTEHTHDRPRQQKRK
ncbi:MAG: hypothetical protein EZS28_028168 [Streblomastix strix]|uniref:Myeloid leukemia factor n=1 Tax=Streblomastix strix TaxID=222440 RepID=A0A5J4V005_9EUKA|nr:MAG: hypothetical protein EZS28_028168 [Streblomastix strix]